MSDAHTRLATYGTLAPGRVNAHVLAELDGEWSKGTIRGRLVQDGWGAEHGYPGIVFDSEVDTVEVHLLTSGDLPDHWARLDAFEGEGYRRVEVTVETPNGPVAACIYALSSNPA